MYDKRLDKSYSGVLRESKSRSSSVDLKKDLKCPGLMNKIESLDMRSVVTHTHNDRCFAIVVTVHFQCNTVTFF